jgi:hypothetical protein
VKHLGVDDDDNIIGGYGLNNWIDLVQGRDKLRALVNTVLYLRVL